MDITNIEEDVGPHTFSAPCLHIHAQAQRERRHAAIDVSLPVFELMEEAPNKELMEHLQISNTLWVRVSNHVEKMDSEMLTLKQEIRSLSPSGIETDFEKMQDAFLEMEDKSQSSNSQLNSVKQRQETADTSLQLLMGEIGALKKKVQMNEEKIGSIQKDGDGIKTAALSAQASCLQMIASYSTDRVKLGASKAAISGLLRRFDLFLKNRFVHQDNTSVHSESEIFSGSGSDQSESEDSADDSEDEASAIFSVYQGTKQPYKCTTFSGQGRAEEVEEEEEEEEPFYMAPHGKGPISWQSGSGQGSAGDDEEEEEEPEAFYMAPHGKGPISWQSGSGQGSAGDDDEEEEEPEAFYMAQHGGKRPIPWDRNSEAQLEEKKGKEDWVEISRPGLKRPRFPTLDHESSDFTLGAEAHLPQSRVKAVNYLYKYGPVSELANLEKETLINMIHASGDNGLGQGAYLIHEMLKKSSELGMMPAAVPPLLKSYSATVLPFDTSHLKLEIVGYCIQTTVPLPHVLKLGDFIAQASALPENRALIGDITILQFLINSAEGMEFAILNSLMKGEAGMFNCTMGHRRSTISNFRLCPGETVQFIQKDAFDTINGVCGPLLENQDHLRSSLERLWPHMLRLASQGAIGFTSSEFKNGITQDERRRLMIEADNEELRNSHSTISTFGLKGPLRPT